MANTSRNIQINTTSYCAVL